MARLCRPIAAIEASSRVGNDFSSLNVRADSSLSRRTAPEIWNAVLSA
jgi:hypothetical protein